MPPGGRPLDRSRRSTSASRRPTSAASESLGRSKASGPAGTTAARSAACSGRAGGVDAHDALAGTEVHAAERRDHPLPRLRLLGGRDGVFQVEDDAVRGHRRRLGDALRAGARNEEETAPEPAHAPPRRCESTSKPAVRRASTMGRVSHGSSRTLKTVLPSEPGTAPTLMMRPS